ALSPSTAALRAAGAAGFSVVRESVSAETGTRVVVLHAAGSTARALARLQGLDPAGVYDFNHLYTDGGAVGLAADPGAAQPAPAPERYPPSTGPRWPRSWSAAPAPFTAQRPGPLCTPWTCSAAFPPGAQWIRWRRRLPGCCASRFRSST